MACSVGVKSTGQRKNHLGRAERDAKGSALSSTRPADRGRRCRKLRSCLWRVLSCLGHVHVFYLSLSGTCRRQTRSVCCMYFCRHGRCAVDGCCCILSVVLHDVSKRSQTVAGNVPRTLQKLNNLKVFIVDWSSLCGEKSTATHNHQNLFCPSQLSQPSFYSCFAPPL